MTTVAANLTCMAADTKVVGGDDVYYNGTKIFVFGSNIIGVAGQGKAMTNFMRWCAEGFPEVTPDKAKGSFEALRLNAAGLFLYTDADDYWPERLTAGCHAIGSGGKAALLAMRHFNQAPREAVTCAMLVDNNTGGDVMVYTLAELMKPKRVRK